MLKWALIPLDNQTDVRYSFYAFHNVVRKFIGVASNDQNMII